MCVSTHSFVGHPGIVFPITADIAHQITLAALMASSGEASQKAISTRVNRSNGHLGWENDI